MSRVKMNTAIEFGDTLWRPFSDLIFKFHSSTRSFYLCILTISPRNNLSTLSLAVGTRLGRRRSDTASNSSSKSPSDLLPNDSLIDHRINLSTLSAVALQKTRPELCRFTGRLGIKSNSCSDYLPSDSLTERITCRVTLSAETFPATPQELCHWAVRHREQLLQRLPAQRLSHRANYPPKNSLSSHSPSDSSGSLFLPGSS
jgi:hypothetical protein